MARFYGVVLPKHSTVRGKTAELIQKIAIALALCILANGFAWAETAPAAEETVPEEAVQKKTEERFSFQDWIKQSRNEIADFLAASWATASSAVSSWANTGQDTLLGWYQTVDAYLSSPQDPCQAFSGFHMT